MIVFEFRYVMNNIDHKDIVCYESMTSCFLHLKM